MFDLKRFHKLRALKRNSPTAEQEFLNVLQVYKNFKLENKTKILKVREH